MSVLGTTMTIPQALGEFSLSQLVSALEVKLETCVHNDFTNLSLSLSEVISAEESLVKAARILRSMRNVFAPINKLPPEVLTHVCASTPNIIPDFAHVCAQVCRFWRHALLSSPSLWKEIHTNDPLHLNVHLARSGKVPLDVHVYKMSPAETLREVVPHLGRIRFLYLPLFVDNDGILDWFREPEMLSLRILCIERAAKEFRLSASMIGRISSLGANITDLSLWNVGTHLSSLTFPRLRHFRLVTQDGFEGPRVLDMIHFLKGHPMLEGLKLSDVKYSYADDADTHIEPVALQHLKSAILGGRPSSPSLGSLPHIEVDLLPYLLIPSTTQCDISISSVNGVFPRGTNYLLTLIRAWKIISRPKGGFGGHSGPTYAKFSINESPSGLIGYLEAWIVGGAGLSAGNENMVVDSRSWLTPDWKTTTTDEDPGVGEAGNEEFQAQLSRLGHYLDPLRWGPSPLTTVKFLVLCGFGHTRNKRKYLQYLRECFRALNRVRELHLYNTNPGMVVHLLQPFEGKSGGMVLLFPLLQLLAFSNCTPVELPRSQFLEMMKNRAKLGNTLKEARVDSEEVDLSELLGVLQQRM